MRRIRKKSKSIFIPLILSILSILILKYTYISLSISILSFILSIIILKDKRIIQIFLIIISLIITSLNIINIYNIYKNNQDIYENKNVLLGTWIYNEYNGKYIFNEDYTYAQYSNESTEDNYCIGTYKYNYGASNESGIHLTKDNTYYYYTLTLKEEYCIIMNKKFNDNYTKKIYFALEKQNKDINELIFVNAETENMFTLKKNN